MDPIVPLRPTCSILRFRKWIQMLAVALTIGIAGISLPAIVAFAQLENQNRIDSAVKAYEESTKQAVENIPDSEVMKRREDDLDRLSRARTDADAAQTAAEATADAGKIVKAKEAAAKAKELEEAARTLADRARTFETSEADKERAQEYREALEKRRAARLAMKELEAELKPKVDERRALSADKELENEITRLRSRIGRAEQPITSASVAALTPILPMTANVATESQALCTFGKATPVSVALEASDNDGNPLKEKLNAALKRALTALLAPSPGGGAAPINISNPDPDNAAKQNKPEKEKGGGPTTATGSPQVPGAGAADPKTAGKPEATPASADVLGGSILDQIDESKTARPPAGATVSRPPAEPAPSTAPKRPDTGLSLLGTKLPDGQAVEEAIDNFAKLADQARARGNREQFEFYRKAVEALASWVAGQLLAAEPYIPGPVRPLTPAEAIAQMAWQDASLTWHGYRGALSDWQAGAQAEPPAPTPGAVEAEPTPAPAQSAASGGESKPGSDKHAETGNKSALAVDKLDQKAEPGRKTPPSGAAADPDKAAGQVTIIFKVTETVLQGGSQGEETKTVMAKFTAPEPALPKTGQTKTAKAKLDTGHDRSPVTCNTGADGRCKAQIPADEREIYGLPALPRAVGLQDKTAADADNDPLLEFVKAYSAIEASQNFGVELPPAKNTGMVIQSGPAKPNLALLAAALADLPPGVQVQKSDFKIGDKTYTRVAFTGPDKSTAEAARKFADRLGKDAQIDQCGEKAPGPPLGMMPVSFSALNSELPQTTVDLRKSVRAEGAAP